MSESLTAIRRVLGAYRSTEAHITEADITAAWAEFEEARADLQSAQTVISLAPDDEWPVAVSDGLTLRCADCGEIPQFDYRVDDSFWRLHVPDEPARRGVVCLPCLDRRCDGRGLAGAVREVQWTGTGHTVVLRATRRYTFGSSLEAPQQVRSPIGRGPGTGPRGTVWRLLGDIEGVDGPANGEPSDA